MVVLEENVIVFCEPLNTAYLHSNAVACSTYGIRPGAHGTNGDTECGPKALSLPNERHVKKHSNSPCETLELAQFIQPHLWASCLFLRHVLGICKLLQFALSGQHVPWPALDPCSLCSQSLPKATLHLKRDCMLVPVSVASSAVLFARLRRHPPWRFV